MTTLPAPVHPTAAPAAAPSAGHWRLPWLARAGWTLYAAAAWVYLLEFPHGLPLPNLDQSLQAIVTLASAEHWSFGQRVIINYGPWTHLGIGFYYAPLFTMNYVFQLVSRVVLIALFCRVSRPLPPVGRTLFLAVNVCTGMLEWEAILMLAAIYAGWLLAEDRTHAGRLIGYAGVALTAAAALMKTYYLVFGVGVFGCVLARHVLRGNGRRPNWLEGASPLGGFLLCAGADWGIAGQSYGDLPAYLRGGLAMMQGHSRAMGFDAAPMAFWLSLAALLVPGTFGIVSLVKGGRTRLVTRLPLAALFAGSLFMAWKQGFTRADEFHVSGYLWTVAVLATALPLFFDRRALAPAWYYASIGGVWTLAACTLAIARPTQAGHLASEFVTLPGRNLHIVFSPDAERARLDSLVNQFRTVCALPRTRAAVGHARIDLFGTAQDLLLLNGLNAAFTPTLEGFLAYTPYLAGLNARCYEPGRAPEFVLFQGGSIDSRWPSLDGARQLRDLLGNYRPRLVESSLLLLQRKPANECAPMRPVLQQHGEVSMDARLDLPADGADWCELEVHRTLIGRLINFLYHEPSLILEATIADGRHGRWTLPPVMAQGGFLLRQGPQSQEDMAHLLAGEPIRHPVASIRLGGSELLRWAIEPEISYRFYRLEPQRPASNQPLPVMGSDAATAGTVVEAVAGGASCTVSRLR